VQTLQQPGGHLRFAAEDRRSDADGATTDFCLNPGKEPAERQADEHDGTADKRKDHGPVFPTPGRNADGADNLRRSRAASKKRETMPASQSRQRSPRR